MASESKAVEREPQAAAAEQALIDSIRSGAQDDFQILVRRYQGRIYSLACRLVGDPLEAEDCAQEAFLKAFQNLNRFEGHSSFYTWLYRIAANVALSRVRHLERRGRGKTRSLEAAREDDSELPLDPPDPGPGPRERVAERELEARIHQALTRLPSNYRVVVVLRDVEDRPYEEVAELTGLPLGTVKSRLHQGRALLQRMLQDAL